MEGFFAGRPDVERMDRYDATGQYNWTQDLWASREGAAARLGEARPLLDELRERIEKLNKTFRTEAKYRGLGGLLAGLTGLQAMSRSQEAEADPLVRQAMGRAEGAAGVMDYLIAEGAAISQKASPDDPALFAVLTAMVVLRLTERRRPTPDISSPQRSA